jgi:hypothetical protein
MARKLKTFETSLGFFDLAIAAPSMKAALEAWGADSNLFHQGAARESKDSDVIAATLAKPGVVLKRPVGSDQPFSEHAGLPTQLEVEHDGRAAKVRPKVKDKPRKPPLRASDPKAERRAALAYEKEQQRREAERRKEEAQREKERERRQQAVAKAQAALEAAEREHDKRAAAIDAARADLEEKSQAEQAHWEKEKNKLAAALRRARG